MTDQPQAAAPPELVDAATSRIYTARHPAPGYVTVALDAEHIGVLVEHERQRGNLLEAASYALLRVEAETSRPEWATDRVHVVIHDPASGLDAIGRRWTHIPDVARTIAMLASWDEIGLLADALRSKAGQALEEGSRSQADTLAARALMLREALHVADPARSLCDGHPRWPGVEGTA